MTVFYYDHFFKHVISCIFYKKIIILFHFFVILDISGVIDKWERIEKT